MPNFLRAYYTRADGENTSGPIRFIASTEGIKRDGKDLKVEDWALDNYRANPIVLWAHNYGWDSTLPIGRADVSIDGNALMADVTFDPDDEFAQAIERKYRSGYLHAVSVGWDTRDKTNELLDISAVPVPGDPDALMERSARGLADLGQKLATLMDDEPTENDDPEQRTADAEAVWFGAACQMARLFRPDADDAESERLQTYRTVSRLYSKLGKHAPEFMGVTELRALGEPELKGLFLEGEPDLIPEWFRDDQAGSVLSARSATELEQVMNLVRGVVERAVIEKATDPEDKPDEQEAVSALARIQEMLSGVTTS